MRHASFFTGAMGLDLGLEMAGWDCVFANEVDPSACRTIRTNRPNLNLVEGDAREISLNSFQDATNIHVGELDLVVGGPPCQAFSTAGKRLGLNDERGNLFLHFLNLAISLEPKIILIENVRGLLSAPLRHRPHNQRGFGFDPLDPEELRGGAFAHLVGLLKERGYIVSFELYDTSRFGIPQRRERLVIMASKLGRIPHMDPSIATNNSHDGPRTFAQAVEGLKGPHEFVPLRQNQLMFVKMLKPGQNWRDLPKALQRKALGNAYECGGGRTGFLRRVAWSAPTPTLVTSPVMPATLLAHPVEDRPLSVQEYARVQTFPDDWVFCGSTAQKYRQIGNAVPVEFGRLIGQHLVQFLETGTVRGLGANKAGSGRSRYKNTGDLEWSPVGAK